MHTPVVATADADARIMVLRDFDPESWTLRFHTDVRSPKSDVIGEGAPLCVLFYDPEAKVQIRCRGTGRIESESQRVQEFWEASDRFARRCYLGAPPGEVRDEPSSGLPDWVEGARPTEEELAPARQNFSALIVEIATINWYYLSFGGHRRAILRRDEANWVTP
ncbi:flavin-binding protein [Qipengyuania sp. 1XM1-15A]|nr:flavin-binding protein [Qipengyuania xiamenensis]